MGRDCHSRCVRAGARSWGLDVSTSDQGWWKSKECIAVLRRRCGRCFRAWHGGAHSQWSQHGSLHSSFARFLWLDLFSFFTRGGGEAGLLGSLVLTRRT